MDIINRLVVFALILILFWILYKWQDQIFAYVTPQNNQDKAIEKKTIVPNNNVNKEQNQQDNNDIPPPLLPTTGKKVTFSDQLDTDSMGSISGSFGSSDLGSLLSNDSL